MNKISLALILTLFFSACGGSGGSDTSPPVVNPTPTPVNTVATFSGDLTGSVTEDSSNAVTGTVSVTDPDTNQAAVQAQTDTATSYGTFSIGADGAWSYTLDNSNADVQSLNANATLNDSISIQSVDGTVQSITITINGLDESTNTPATFSGDTTGNVIAGDTAAVTGTVNLSDPDTGENLIVVQTNVAQTYGSFSIGADGAWTYTLDNSNTDLQGLTGGASLTEEVSISSVDQTPSTITITINGGGAVATFAAAFLNGSIDEFSFDNGVTSNGNDNADAWDMTPPGKIVNNSGVEVDNPYRMIWNNTDLNTFIETISLNNEAPGISTTSNSGARSLKFQEIQRRAYQPFAVQAGVEYIVKFWAKAQGAGELSVYIISDNITDESSLESGNLGKVVVTGGVNNMDAFQEYEITFTANSTRALFYAKPGASVNATNQLWIDDISVLTPSYTGTSTLNPILPPSGNFELIDWKLQNHIDGDNDGRSDEIDEEDVANGFYDSDYFYTATDGGMVFRVPVVGAKTSTNTSFTRTELREMLRKGNRSFSTQGVGGNNWVFGSAPVADQQVSGGVDGTLKGTLAVNHVTTTGDADQVGRVIFAQIHANDDEPIRFYYRKLPNNTKGSIYFAHEPIGLPDVYFEMVGSRSQSQSDPADGIALNEKFSYEIITVGNEMTVKLIREGKPDIVETVDMSASGYDVGGQYMYFKAGAYIQDNTGEATDYAQLTYYDLQNTHD